MIVNLDELRQHFDGDEELIGEIVEVFEMTYPEAFTALKNALDQQNWKEVELHAHTLKGMVANFFASELKDACFSLEQIGRDGGGQETGGHLNVLEEKLPQMMEELKKIA